MNYNYDLNNINEGKGFFAALFAGIVGMIGWTSMKIFNKVMKTGKTIYLQRYLDSVEQQIVNGTKSDKPDGFIKIIDLAKSELNTDYEKTQKLFDDIKNNIESNENNINPSNVRLINNAQKYFEKKYVDNVNKLLTDLINQYDQQIIAAIDKFNEQYNKKESVGKKINGDKLKKVWESYKNKIEDIKDSTINEFEQSDEFKKLYDLLFGQMNKIKKELEQSFDEDLKDSLELQRIVISQPINAGIMTEQKSGPVNLNVSYVLTSKEFRKNKNVLDNYSALITTFDQKLYEKSLNDLIKLAKNNNFNDILNYVNNLKNENNNVNKLTYVFVNNSVNLTLKNDNNGNKFNVILNYHSKGSGDGNVLYENVPILNRYSDETNTSDNDSEAHENIGVIGIIILKNNETNKMYKSFIDGQIYLNNNNTGKYSISFKND